MEDRSSERGKHKINAGMDGGGKGMEEVVRERENKVRDDMHDIKHKNNTAQK